MSVPPQTSYVVAPPPPAHWWRRRQVGAPVALIIVGAVLAGLFALVGFAVNPIFFTMGMLPSLIAFGIGVWGCLWLDRWEPEPFSLIALALTWGGGLAIPASLILEVALFGRGDFVDAAIVAPLAEEAMKGSFVLFMLTGLRKREMNSITDHISYAALVGFGFAFIENLVYFSSAESAADVALMAIVRTGFDMFGHPLATVVFSLGVWYARQRNNGLLGVLGFVGAVILHGSWNGAAVSGELIALVLVYVLLLVPTLIVVLWLATRGRRDEAHLLGRYLPEMVINGLIAPQEAAWIGDLKARSQVRASVASSAEGKAHVAYMLDSVVQLAHVRARFDAGRGNAELLAEQIELVNGIHLERAAALGWMPHPFVQGAPYAAPQPTWAPPSGPAAAPPAWPAPSTAPQQAAWPPPAPPTPAPPAPAQPSAAGSQQPTQAPAAQGMPGGQPVDFWRRN